MKNKKVLVSIIVSLCVVAGGTYYWWIGTPEYSLSELKSAYATHDVEKAFKYFDTDSIFDNFWLEFKKKNLEQITEEDNGFAQLGYMLGQSMIENMKPAIKEKLKDSLTESVKGSSTATSTSKYNEMLLTKKYTLTKVDKNTTLIDFTDQKIKFKLIKSPERYWKIVAIEGLLDDEVVSTKSE